MRRFIIAALLLASPGLAQEPLFDAEGYRIAHYRAPVRQPPAGVGRIAPAAAAQLMSNRDAIFIDVLPAEGGWRPSMNPSPARTGSPKQGAASPILSSRKPLPRAWPG